MNPTSRCQGRGKKKKSWGMVNVKIDPTSLWHEHCCEMSNTQQAKVQVWGQKVQDISVAWLKNSSVVLVLEVSVLLWRFVDHCECWTCAWLLSLVVIVLTLLCTTEPRGTKFTVWSNTSQAIVNLSLTVYNYTSWRQNVADFFDIRLHIGSWGFFCCFWTSIYSSVCLDCIS